MEEPALEEGLKEEDCPRKSVIEDRAETEAPPILKRRPKSFLVPMSVPLLVVLILVCVSLLISYLVHRSSIVDKEPPKSEPDQEDPPPPLLLLGELAPLIRGLPKNSITSHRSGERSEHRRVGVPQVGNMWAIDAVSELDISEGSGGRILASDIEATERLLFTNLERTVIKDDSIVDSSRILIDEVNADERLASNILADSPGGSEYIVNSDPGYLSESREDADHIIYQVEAKSVHASESSPPSSPEVIQPLLATQDIELGDQIVVESESSEQPLTVIDTDTSLGLSGDVSLSHGLENPSLFQVSETEMSAVTVERKAPSSASSAFEDDDDFDLHALLPVHDDIEVVSDFVQSTTILDHPDDALQMISCAPVSIAGESSELVDARLEGISGSIQSSSGSLITPVSAQQTAAEFFSSLLDESTALESATQVQQMADPTVASLSTQSIVTPKSNRKRRLSESEDSDGVTDLEASIAVTDDASRLRLELDNERAAFSLSGSESSDDSEDSDPEYRYSDEETDDELESRSLRPGNPDDSFSDEDCLKSGKSTEIDSVVDGEEFIEFMKNIFDENDPEQSPVVETPTVSADLFDMLDSLPVVEGFTDNLIPEVYEKLEDVVLEIEVPSSGLSPDTSSELTGRLSGPTNPADFLSSLLGESEIVPNKSKVIDLTSMFMGSYEEKKVVWLFEKEGRTFSLEIVQAPLVVSETSAMVQSTRFSNTQVLRRAMEAWMKGIEKAKEFANVFSEVLKDFVTRPAYECKQTNLKYEVVFELVIADSGQVARSSIIIKEITQDLLQGSFEDVLKTTSQLRKVTQGKESDFIECLKAVSLKEKVRYINGDITEVELFTLAIDTCKSSEQSSTLLEAESPMITESVFDPETMWQSEAPTDYTSEPAPFSKAAKRLLPSKAGKRKVPETIVEEDEESTDDESCTSERGSKRWIFQKGIKIFVFEVQDDDIDHSLEKAISNWVEKDAPLPADLFDFAAVAESIVKPALPIDETERIDAIQTIEGIYHGSLVIGEYGGNERGFISDSSREASRCLVALQYRYYEHMKILSNLSICHQIPRKLLNQLALDNISLVDFWDTLPLQVKLSFWKKQTKVLYIIIGHRDLFEIALAASRMTWDNAEIERPENTGTLTRSSSSLSSLGHTSVGSSLSRSSRSGSLSGFPSGNSMSTDSMSGASLSGDSLSDSLFSYDPYYDGPEFPLNDHSLDENAFVFEGDGKLIAVEVHGHEALGRGIARERFVKWFLDGDDDQELLDAFPSYIISILQQPAIRISKHVKVAVKLFEFIPANSRGTFASITFKELSVKDDFMRFFSDLLSDNEFVRQRLESWLETSPDEASNTIWSSSTLQEKVDFMLGKPIAEIALAVIDRFEEEERCRLGEQPLDHKGSSEKPARLLNSLSATASAPELLETETWIYEEEDYLFSVQAVDLHGSHNLKGMRVLSDWYNDGVDSDVFSVSFESRLNRPAVQLETISSISSIAESMEFYTSESSGFLVIHQLRMSDRFLRFFQELQLRTDFLTEFVSPLSALSEESSSNRDDFFQWIKCKNEDEILTVWRRLSLDLKVRAVEKVLPTDLISLLYAYYTDSVIPQEKLRDTINRQIREVSQSELKKISVSADRAQATFLRKRHALRYLDDTESLEVESLPTELTSIREDATEKNSALSSKEQGIDVSRRTRIQGFLDVVRSVRATSSSAPIELSSRAESELVRATKEEESARLRLAFLESSPSRPRPKKIDLSSLTWEPVKEGKGPSIMQPAKEPLIDQKAVKKMEYASSQSPPVQSIDTMSDGISQMHKIRELSKMVLEEKSRRVTRSPPANTDKEVMNFLANRPSRLGASSTKKNRSPWSWQWQAVKEGKTPEGKTPVQDWSESLTDLKALENARSRYARSRIDLRSDWRLRDDHDRFATGGMTLSEFGRLYAKREQTRKNDE